MESGLHTLAVAMSGKPWASLQVVKNNLCLKGVHKIWLPYSSAIRPHSRKGRTPDFGHKKKKKRGKTGEKNGGKKTGKKWGKKLNTCLLFSWRPSSFGLINIWLKFQEYRMASTINLTIESLVKLKATNMWKHVWDCALSTSDRRPSCNK